MRYPALLTDLYELTMLAGYFDEGMHETPATFDLFFREAPFKGSFAVFAGLEPALEYLTNLRFTEDDLTYLRSLNIFKPAFLDFLKNFRFRGQVIAPPEGTVVFANEPLLTVEGRLAEAQFVETALLNIINFQTLVATKAARITVAAQDGVVLEFGLRRAQGPDGGLSAARAAYIGGVHSTSNVQAGQMFGIPVKGTHAHSWVMAFPDELRAFRAYAECFPDSCVLLVDTYDTLKSGLPNALIVARELREKGYQMLGVRLDSGDLAYLSKAARRMFDEAGFPELKIVASNELDEYIIRSIRDEGGQIDIYGVGTKLATCAGEGGGALGGVYKLVRLADQPKLKVTSDIAKATLPDRKHLWRALDSQGNFLMDIIAREEEIVKPGQEVYDPTNPARRKILAENVTLENVRQTVMDAGQKCYNPEPLERLSERCADQLRRLPEGSLRLFNPHRYKVSISPQLHELRNHLMETVQS
ncbi:nicotinate phosphoribosyltransferase [Desulfuromonas sp. AOP6]|uniref:nicotinate phosphoribosyltransferase n=1 Tax=Desulfuromonas sp. AOP6 TaxID=1566351 RepID=UPI0012829BE1|nr:nicotinate phosphoribosyltransferase [Desulfuromonas sp. AOP6]BCA79250.1 nicotinate phosphoribosyltransferase [Desulfuromonas sp. AOP6]